MNRCAWARNDLAITYHDEEWGVPRYEDRTLFEFLLLEGAQAGLSWDTILRKREAYRRSFYNYDPVRIAKMTARDAERLLAPPKSEDTITIVRNRLKVHSAIANARAYQLVAKEYADHGGFSGYLWSFVGGRPIINHHKSICTVPAETPESRAMSKDLKQRGFTFVGPTICYALMQAVGMVNDHTTDCFRHPQLLPNVQPAPAKRTTASACIPSSRTARS